MSILKNSLKLLKLITYEEQENETNMDKNTTTMYAMHLLDMLSRLATLEREWATLFPNASTTKFCENWINKPDTHSPSENSICVLHEIRQNTIKIRNLLLGIQENCTVSTRALRLFPDCFSKIEWMKASWESDTCFKNAGVDGSHCSFVKYLSEYENHCPPIESRRPLVFERITTIKNTNTDLSMLLRKFDGVDTLTKSVAFITKRLQRLWPAWTEGVYEYAHRAKQRGILDPVTLIGGVQLNILVYMGFLSVKAFDEQSDSGGPLGEYVQWTDLIATLHILGHNITIAMTTNQMQDAFDRVESRGFRKCIRTTRLFDIVFVDIIGYRELLKYLSSIQVKQPSCTFRILDSFGTQAKFNYESYNAPKYASHYFKTPTDNGWGHLNLNLKQFYTMFPHTVDNSFLGFIAERSRKELNRSSVASTSSRPIALVYGKSKYMWEAKGVAEFIAILNDYFEIHATVADATSVHLVTKNYKLLSGDEYFRVLRTAKIFVGFGFPYEGPAPLEAIANGVIFVNPVFDPPHSRYITDFFREKPTARNITSQNPYIELHIGEPYSYTVNMQDAVSVRSLFQKLMHHPKIEEYMTYEFTTGGMLERLRAYLTHQHLCVQLPPPVGSRHSRRIFDPTAVREVAWPPNVTILLAGPGESCSWACRQHKPGFECAFEHFPRLNKHSYLAEQGAVACQLVVASPHLAHPAVAHTSQKTVCLLQGDAMLFDCEAPGESIESRPIRRICPCRDSLPGQVALCRRCF